MPEDGAGFDEQQWFQDLFDFGVVSPDAAAGNGDASGAHALSADDPDAQLIPQLVAKVALPRVIHAVEKAWRPERRRQSARLAAVLRELAAFLPPDDAALLALHAAVAAKLVAAAGAVRVPAWHPGAVRLAGDDAQRLAASAAARATRLLAAIGYFEGALPRAALHAPALDTLLSRALVPHIRALAQHPTGVAAAARRTLRVAEVLPASWIHGACACVAAASSCEVC